MSSYPLLAVPYIEATSPSFRAELVRRALEADLNPSLIAAVMSFESQFNPKAVNRYSGATGLIQWMPDNFPVSELASLSAEKQLSYAIAWFKGKNLARLGASATPTDYYLSVFLPAFAGYSPSTVLGQKGSNELLRLSSGKSTGLSLGKMYDQNPAFDTSKKGYYTVGDVGAKIEKLVAGAQGRAPIPVPLPVASPPRPRTATNVPPPLPPPTLTLPPFSPAPSSPRQRPALSARIGSSRTVLRAAIPAPLPPLVRGDHGHAVLLLQRLLNATMAEGEDVTVEMDGEFGAQTELWVALHQVEADLYPDGECGPLTWLSFTDERFWGCDRIGMQMYDEPYGDAPPLPGFPHALAETLMAPPPMKPAPAPMKPAPAPMKPAPAPAPPIDKPTAAPFELHKPVEPQPPTRRSR